MGQILRDDFRKLDTEVSDYFDVSCVSWSKLHDEHSVEPDPDPPPPNTPCPPSVQKIRGGGIKKQQKNSLALRAREGCYLSKTMFLKRFTVNPILIFFKNDFSFEPHFEKCEISQTTKLLQCVFVYTPCPLHRVLHLVLDKETY